MPRWPHFYAIRLQAVDLDQERVISCGFGQAVDCVVGVL